MGLIIMETKQKEIREGIKGLTFFVEDTEYWEIGNLFVLREKAITKLLNYLHSKGVVLKVADTSQDTMGFYHPDIVQVESLIYDAGLNPDSTEPAFQEE